MRIRYHPFFAVLLVALGAVCTFMGLWLLALGEFSPATFVGLVPMLIGVLYLVRPYFWVFPSVVTVPALLGPMKRQFPFQSLEVEDTRLIAVAADGTRKRLPVARWLTHSADWKAIVDKHQNAIGTMR